MQDWQMVKLANELWGKRWHWPGDFNQDGAITITDVWLGFKWLFFAPGDFIILMVMSHLPSVAIFLELGAATLSGLLSLFLSAIVWIISLVVLRVIDDR